MAEVWATNSRWRAKGIDLGVDAADAGDGIEATPDSHSEPDRYSGMDFQHSPIRVANYSVHVPM